MILKSYYGKKVTVVDVNGQVFTGKVDEYFFPEDNDNGKESIILKTTDNEFVEFTDDTIEKITVN